MLDNIKTDREMIDEFDNLQKVKKEIDNKIEKNKRKNNIPCCSKKY